jgi:hypothetical protein
MQVVVLPTPPFWFENVIILGDFGIGFILKPIISPKIVNHN